MQRYVSGVPHAEHDWLERRVARTGRRERVSVVHEVHPIHEDRSERVVQRILSYEQRFRFKRRLMLIARLSGSAVNLDQEIPRD